MNLKSKVLSTNIYIYRTGAKLGTAAIYFIQIVTWYQCHTIDTSDIRHALVQDIRRQIKGIPVCTSYSP